MVNTGLGGGLSSGKTACMTKFGIEDKAKYRKEIIANYHITGERYITNEEFIIDCYRLVKLHDLKVIVKYENKILLLDEIGQIINARKFGSDVTEYVLQVLTMLGKIDCDLYFTFQVMESQVDKVLREITYIVGYCERISASGKKGFTLPRITTEKIKILVSWEILEGKKMRKFKEWQDVDCVFGLYDTRELIFTDRNCIKNLV